MPQVETKHTQPKPLSRGDRSCIKIRKSRVLPWIALQYLFFADLKGAQRAFAQPLPKASLKSQKRNAERAEGDGVGNKKARPAIAITKVREAPYIAWNSDLSDRN